MSTGVQYLITLTKPLQKLPKQQDKKSCAHNKPQKLSCPWNAIIPPKKMYHVAKGLSKTSWSSMVLNNNTKVLCHRGFQPYNHGFTGPGGFLLLPMGGESWFAPRPLPWQQLWCKALKKVLVKEEPVNIVIIEFKIFSIYTTYLIYLLLIDSKNKQLLALCKDSAWINIPACCWICVYIYKYYIQMLTWHKLLNSPKCLDNLCSCVGIFEAQTLNNDFIWFWVTFAL